MKSTVRLEYKPFADALRAAMRRKNLNASEVARRIWGTTKDNRGYDVARNRDRIGAYLAGTSYPEQENLQKLAAAVGITVEELTIERKLGPKPRQPSSDLQIIQLVENPRKAQFRLDKVLDLRLIMQIVQMIADAEDAEMKPPTSSEEQLDGG